MNEKQGTRGQTIVEAIVVIGLVVLLVTGLIAGTTSSLRSVQGSRTKNQALKYAEEAIEFARNLRNQQWATFQSKSGLYCLGATLTLTPTPPPCSVNITSPEGTYTRSVNFSWDGTKMTVVASVSYVIGATSQKVSLSTYFTQWK